jgi:hypothetical protein
VSQLLKLLIQLDHLLLLSLLIGLFIQFQLLQLLLHPGFLVVCHMHMLAVIASLSSTFLLLLSYHISYLFALFLVEAHLLVLHLHLPRVFPVLIPQQLAFLLGLSQLLVQLVHLLLILLVLPIDAVERHVLVPRDLLHRLHILLQLVQLLRFVLQLILKAVNGVDVVGGLKLLPHLLHFLLQAEKLTRSLFNLSILVKQSRIGLQLIFNFGTPLFLELPDLTVHFGDYLEKLKL